jgi:hypothetical protein
MNREEKINSALKETSDRSKNIAIALIRKIEEKQVLQNYEKFKEVRLGESPGLPKIAEHDGDFIAQFLSVYFRMNVRYIRTDYDTWELVFSKAENNLEMNEK